MAFLAAGVALPSTAEASSLFEDVNGGSTGEAVDALAEEGIIAGCDDGEFCPDDVLTRGQMASLIAKSLDLPFANDSGFGDIEDSVHAANIERIAAAGLTEGCEEGRFCPDDEVTRGQFASLLDRAFGPPETDEVFFDDTNGVHGDAINRLAAAGLAAGCGDPLTHFCTADPVQRWQAALFLARAMDLTASVELSSLDERREQQAEIDAEEARRLEEERKAKEEQRRREQEKAERYAIWDALADCESGDRINGVPVEGTARWHTGATDPALDERPSWSSGIYYGGLQFHPTTWSSYRDADMPSNAGDATREQEIKVGERVQAAQGWAAWPTCSSMIGLR